MNRVELFWTEVDRSGGPDACWPWLGSVNGHGDGIRMIHGRRDYVYRWAWRFTHNQEPPPRLSRKCPTISCCNPAHWVEGSKTLSSWFSVNRRTNGRGPRGPKLLPEDAQQIRAGAAKGQQLSWLAKKYGVSYEAVRRIVNGTRGVKSWDPKRLSVIAL